MTRNNIASPILVDFWTTVGVESGYYSQKILKTQLKLWNCWERCIPFVLRFKCDICPQAFKPPPPRKVKAFNLEVCSESLTTRDSYSVPDFPTLMHGRHQVQVAQLSLVYTACGCCVFFKDTITTTRHHHHHIIIDDALFSLLRIKTMFQI
jgi:hypothetical protein